MDIYKVKTAEYEEAWDTNFLLAVIPIFVSILKFTGQSQDMINNSTYFMKQLLIVREGIELLRDFCLNKNTGNIAMM